MNERNEQATAPEPSSPRRDGRNGLLGMGLCCALAGLLCGLWVESRALGDGWESFPVFSTLAAGVSGVLFWWLLLVRPYQFSVTRGVVAGVLSSLVAHYLCWYLLITSSWLCAVLWGGCLSSLGERAMNPLEALLGAAVFSFWSLYLLAWVTIPAGAILGAIVGALHEDRR